jgi:putative protease
VTPLNAPKELFKGGGEKRLSNLKIGKVTHYYEKLGVAIVELNDNLIVGDKIKFVRGGDELFEQTVESMQMEHENIKSAGRGDVVGLKTMQEVKEGAEIFKSS